jgi:hypothetical protein
MMRLPSAITANANARHTVSVARSCGIRSRIFFPSAEAEAGLRIRDTRLNATETMEGKPKHGGRRLIRHTLRQVFFTETSNTRLTEGRCDRVRFGALASTGERPPASMRCVLDGASSSAQCKLVGTMKKGPGDPRPFYCFRETVALT